MKLYSYSKEDVATILAEYVYAKLLKQNNQGTMQIKAKDDGGYDVIFMEEKSTSN